MAVPSSGQLREYADIGVELGVAQSNVSLRGMSQTAGFSAPDAMSEFYGYSAVTPTDNFKSLVYIGDGLEPSAKTGLNFQPSFVWVTARLAGYPNYLFYRQDPTSIWKLGSYQNNAPTNAATDDEMLSFDSNGFTTGNDAQTNQNGVQFSSWSWNAGTFASNFNGSITSYLSANPNGGFSIVRHAATGASGTIGHGLNSAPKLILSKSEGSAQAWNAQCGVTGSFEYGVRAGSFSSNSSGSSVTNAITSANSTVFGVGNNATVNGSGNFVHFCFADVTGYQKIDKYIGTGANQSITTGFPVKWLMIKSGTAAGDAVGNWHVF